MARCPYCNVMDIDYNLIIHYKDKLNYFINHAVLCQCFKCKLYFYSSASSPHFYDRIYSTKEDFEEIKKNYYYSNNLINLLSPELQKSYNQLIISYNNNFNNYAKMVCIFNILRVFLQTTNDPQGNLLKQTIKNLNNKRIDKLLSKLLSNYKKFTKLNIIDTKIGTNKSYKMINLILMIYYKLHPIQKKLAIDFIKSQNETYLELTKYIKDVYK